MRSLVSGEDNMSQKDPLLSVIILARNEEARIARCVRSLSFADEILVFDNGSDDRTAEIAKKHGAVVHALQSSDFSKLRNSTVTYAKGSWILYVDADEWVSAELAENIRRILIPETMEHPVAYELYRKNYYLGQPWPTGEWMLRLFLRSSMGLWKGELHETPTTHGEVGRLKGILFHDTHRTLEEMVKKTNEWSETEAALRLAASHPPITWWRLMRVMITGFTDSFFRKCGYRAGTMGWIESIYQGFSMFITYAKLWEMQTNGKTKK